MTCTTPKKVSHLSFVNPYDRHYKSSSTPTYRALEGFLIQDPVGAVEEGAGGVGVGVRRHQARLALVSEG